jgi:hypothetical protein
MVPLWLMTIMSESMRDAMAGGAAVKREPMHRVGGGRRKEEEELTVGEAD